MKKLILLIALLFSFLANAQKAITVTEPLKDANTTLFRNFEVNSIKRFGSIPKSFFSLVYNPGQRTDGYHTLNVSIHIGEGFADIITPSYDVSIERLGAIFYDAPNEVFTFPIIDLTQQEQDDYQQQIDDNDSSSQTNLNHKNKGVEAFDRIYAVIQRKFDRGDLTSSQAKGLMENLYDSLEPLYKGQWRLAKLRMNNETPPNNATLLNIFNTIKSIIDNYVAENY